MKNFKRYSEMSAGWTLEVLEVDGVKYFLDGWNGEEWLDCWVEGDPSSSYQIRPIMAGVGEPNEDGDFEQYEEVDFKIGGV